MPIVVDPHYSPAAPAQISSSADGRLTVFSDDEHAGALLVANFAEEVLRTNRIQDPRRVNAANPDGWTTGLPVGGGMTAVSAYSGNVAAVAGEVWTFSADVTAPPGSTVTVSVAVRPTVDGSFAPGATFPYEEMDYTIPAGTTRRVFDSHVVQPGANGVRPQLYRLSLTDGSVVVSRMTLVKGSTTDYFGGDTDPVPGRLYRWLGSPNASSSEEYRPGLPVLPRRVRFTRGDGTPVRSGYDAYAPGGIAVAYDHEAPTGSAVTWMATPVLPDGSLGDPTGAAMITVAQAAPSRVFLKPMFDPGKTVSVKVSAAEETGRALRAALDPVVGSPFPAGSWDVPLGWTGRVTFRTDTEQDYWQLVEALSQGVLLMQPSGCSGIPAQMYVMPQGQLAAARLPGAETGFGWRYRAWAVDLVQVDRPDPQGAPLYVPGVTWGSVGQDYPSWSALAAANTSWVALLGGTV